MNLSFTVPSDFREKLLSAKLNFSTDDGGPDTFNVLLMRNGFTYSSSNHQILANVSTSNGGQSLYVTAATKTITRAAGAGFTTFGFVVGNHITFGSGTNTGVYIIRSITDDAIRIDAVSGTVATDGTDVSPVTRTITSQDEMASITTGAINYGIVGTTGIFTRTSGGSTSFVTDGFVVGTRFTTDNTPNFGPYEVTAVEATELTAVPVGNVAALQDDTVTGGTMTNGYSRGTLTATFTLDGSLLQLDSYDWSDFGAALGNSPGIIIYDDTSSDKSIVCYAKFSDWSVTF